MDSKLLAFKQLRQIVPNMFFFVSRDSDLHVVVCDGVRHEQKLSRHVADHHAVDLAYISRRPTTVSSVLVSNFYGFTPAEAVSPGIYTTTMHAFPDRKLTLHLLPNKIIAKSRVGDCLNAVVVSAHLHGDFTALVPDLTGITLTGFDQDRKRPVEEYIAITNELRAKFDVASITKSYLFG